MKLLLSILCLSAFLSCAIVNGSSTKCPGKSNYKHKTYRVKKVKRSARPVYSASTSSKNSTSLSSNSTSSNSNSNSNSPSEESSSQSNSVPQPSTSDSLSIQAVNEVDAPSLRVAVPITDSLQIQTISAQQSNTTSQSSTTSLPPQGPNSQVSTPNSSSQSNETARSNPPTEVAQTNNSTILTSPEQPQTSSTTINPLPTVQQKQDSIALLTGADVNLDHELPDYDPETQLVFKGKVYEKDEDIEFNETIRFIPNYSVFVNDSLAFSKLEELANLLKEYPDKKVRIISHAGWDVEMEEDVKDYQWNPYTGTDVRILYGRGTDVYAQTIYGLGLENVEYLEKIESLGLPDVTEAEVGKLLRARALQVKSTLIEQYGVNKKQIVTAVGAFERVNEHIVEFKVK